MRTTVRGRVVAGALATVLVAGSGVAMPVAAHAAKKQPAAKAKSHGTSSSASSSATTGAASGGANPLGGGGLTVPGGATPTPTATTPPVVVNTSTGSGSGGGISSGTAIGIAVAAFVIIAGILFAVFRDARKRLPKAHATTQERIPGSRRPPKARKLSSAERKRRKRGRAPRRR